MNWSGLLALRRGHLRRAARDGGPDRVLPRVNVHRRLDLRLGPPLAGLHLATIWLAAIGTVLSAYFILVANSWMQHPVGYKIDPETTTPSHRHLRGAVQLDGVARLPAHHLRRVHDRRHARARDLGLAALRVSATPSLLSRSARLALPLTLVAVIADRDLRRRPGSPAGSEQPMKMAAAEALYNTTNGAGLSLFATASFTRHPKRLTSDLSYPAPARR